MVSLPPRTILYGFSAGSDTTKVKKIILARYIDSRIFFRVATGYAKEGDTAREANDDITRENDGDAARENDGSSSSVHGCPNEAKHDVSTRAAHGATITYILTFTNNTTMVVSKEANDIQNEADRMLFPFTVDCRARTELGSTYITSFCCK